MINDRISDMITRLRNGYQAAKVLVSMPHTLVLERIAKVLVEEKYLAASEVKTDETGHKQLVLTLAYSGHKPSISSIRRLSKPGVRLYSKTTAIRPVLSGLGICIMSTSQGIMTDRSAKKAKVGGEVLFELW